MVNPNFNFKRIYRALEPFHCKKRHFVPNRYLYLKHIKSVQSDWNYLEQKQNMLFNITLIQIDISTKYLVQSGVFYSVAIRRCIHFLIFPTFLLVLDL